MSAVQESVTIRAGKARVFDAYVNHIDRWWPRMGTYRYTFAPANVGPRHIRFEPYLGGRFYETFDDETEYVIGRITVWEPPDRLAYTWQDRRWTSVTTVEVRFEEEAGETRVTVTHDGFGEGDVPDEAAGFAVGHAEILTELKAWVLTQQPS